MWSNTDKVQLERCDQIQIMVNKKDVVKYRLRSTRKMWSNTDKGSTRKMWSNTDNGQPERCDQIQIKVN